MDKKKDISSISVSKIQSKVQQLVPVIDVFKKHYMVVAAELKKINSALNRVSGKFTPNFIQELNEIIKTISEQIEIGR